MPRRDQHIVLRLAALTVLFVLVRAVTGISGDLHLAAPALLLPLLAAATLARGASRVRPLRPRRRPRAVRGTLIPYVG
jgi:hypothetical protein